MSHDHGGTAPPGTELSGPWRPEADFPQVGRKDPADHHEAYWLYGYDPGSGIGHYLYLAAEKDDLLLRRESIFVLLPDGSVLAQQGAGRDSRGATAAGNRLFFVFTDSTHGSELWTSDGTAEGTRMVTDAMPGVDSGLSGFSNPLQPLFSSGGVVLYSACTDSDGCELWRSDGTPAGTDLVKDVVPGSTGADPTEITGVGAVVFFRVGYPYEVSLLWRSNGTAEGTRRVRW